MFVGEVVDVQRTDGVETARIRVTRADKGITPDTSIVTLIAPHTSCSLEWRAGERWVVYADTGPRGLRSSLCAGSRKLAADAPLPDLRPEPGVVDGWLVRPKPGPGVAAVDRRRDRLGRDARRPDGGGPAPTASSGSPASPGSWTVEFDLGGREAAVARGDRDVPTVGATVLAIAEPVPR